MKAKILVVDDNPDIVEVIEARLGLKGYQVISACDGAAALAKTIEERPDLILLDITMPRMDGLEFARKLRKTPLIASTLIIMVTDRSGYNDLLKSLGELDTVGYISKPFSSEELIQKVENALFLKPKEVKDGSGEDISDR